MIREPTSSRDRHARHAGFTLLEILVAMAIFSVLGSMVVVFMRQSLDIFYAGTKQSAEMDRKDAVLPQIREDLSSLTIPGDFTPPRPPPTDDQIARMNKANLPPPPPAEAVRLRAGYLTLRNTGDERFKNYPCFYMAWVTTNASEWSDRLKRRAGETPKGDGELKSLTPGSIAGSDADTRYRATGGLTEVVWIAVPRDLMEKRAKDEVIYPAILTLYRGFRSPIGDPDKSLLVPENLDERDEILKACRPVAEGLLHFGAKWRRVFATTWDAEIGVGQGDTAPYVGPVWDSTRALEKTWPLYRGADSLPDASDDIFPAFVTLEATLAATGPFGAGRGELRILEPLTADASKLKVSDTDILLQPNLGRERWLKIDGEWMSYDVRDVNWERKEVRVRRGGRGTKKSTHDTGAWAYVGTPSRLQMRLPIFHDRYVVREGR